VRLFGRIFFLFILLSPLSARAWPPEFGAEFTFTSEKVKEEYSKSHPFWSPEKRRLFEAWGSRFRAQCEIRQCQVYPRQVKSQDSWYVKFPDGFWIELAVDPYVFEATLQKGSRLNFQRHKEVIDDFIFKPARDLGLTADPWLGGGHISIDMLSAFGSDALLLRNFLVDQANFPELQLYVLGGDLGNAPPVSSLKESSQEAFKELIAGFDQEHWTLNALISRVQFHVYNNNPRGFPSRHAQAVRLSEAGRLTDSLPLPGQRLELRYFRAQDSLEKFLQQTDLLEKRLAWLKSLNEPLALKLPETVEMPPEKQLNAFSYWLEQIGEKLEDHINLLPTDLRPLCKSLLPGRHS
jgi:hypothetical protein